ncbi:hypothetical protein PVL29_001339 [Vitis rotundifolia]|uniref:Elongation factor Ts, mitochondrial n=1 Tax=Vitis rotundifolia TaxID=103349 RepID=A0AA39ALE3_VITRO|nr:hypothetical protein PVL29_001339 [Vitis rotundifolia]
MRTGNLVSNLSETGGDIVKAQDSLRKKGLASADKKASRATAAGRIGSYVHDSRTGILIEVNCKTDFAARDDIFKEQNDLFQQSQDFASKVAAQTAATPPSTLRKEQPAAVAINDTAEKPPTVTVSVALVKQLREETGAGMMDCKRALHAGGGAD